MRAIFWLLPTLAIVMLIVILILLGIVASGFFIVVLPIVFFGGFTSTGYKSREKYRVCYNCGFPLRGDENYCPRCGVRLK